MITGDFHGQFYDLLGILDKVGGPPPKNKWLIMGDYVDRGNHSIETVCLLLAYKVRYPDKMFMIRGNHESVEITRLYGFYHECRKRYNLSLWRCFVDLFNYLPVAALIDERILCMHGGLSPSLDNFQQISDIQRPTEVPTEGILCDLLWADPREKNDKRTGWDENEDRGISHIFGPEIVQQFCDKHNLDLICRAHQVMEEGYEFYADRKLITVFSAPNYQDFDNKGAVVEVDSRLCCKIHQFDPFIKSINMGMGSS